MNEWIVFQPGFLSRLGDHYWMNGVVPTLSAEPFDNAPHVAIFFDVYNQKAWEDITVPLRTDHDAGDCVFIIDGTRVNDVRVYDDEITPCLKSRMGTGGNNVPFVAFASNQRSEVRDIGDIAVALSAEPGTNQQTYIAQETDMIDDPIAFSHYSSELSPGDMVPTLRSGTNGTGHAVTTGEPMMQVRRLTPIECERLMGWPDNHTLPRADGKTNSDTTRYKMCGNGVASPVAEWIAQHIMTVMED